MWTVKRGGWRWEIGECVRSMDKIEFRSFIPAM